MPADDALGPLREVLRQPDQRTWRRFLPAPRGAHRTSPPAQQAAPLDPWPGDPPDVEDTRGPRSWQVVAGVLILAAGIVLGTGLLPATPTGRSPGLADVPPPSSDDVPMSTLPPTSDVAALRVWPVERVEVVDRVVRTDVGRWEVGAEGDVVTVGDWNCDRSPTPAVLRPADGRVAVFDRWAAAEGAEAARPVGVVAGAATLRPARTCGELVVRTAAGEERVLDTRTGRHEGSR